MTDEEEIQRLSNLVRDTKALVTASATCQETPGQDSGAPMVHAYAKGGIEGQHLILFCVRCGRVKLCYVGVRK